MAKDGTEISASGLSRRRAMRLAAAASATGAALTGPAVAAWMTTPVAEPVAADFKVVLHAAQADHWLYVVSNLDNLREEWPDARLRVVVDGAAVGMLLGESDLTRSLATALAHGVELYVCPNALREHGITPAAMPAGAITALGGVVALVQAANQGFVYVKP